MQLFVNKEEVIKETDNFIESWRTCLYFKNKKEFLNFKAFLDDVEECVNKNGKCEGHHYMDSDESLRDGKSGDVVFVISDEEE